MRVMIFTGKGGVGTTTAAAATATLGALRGLRTLVVSTDPTGSLGDVLDAPVGVEATELDDRLYARQLDPARLLETQWASFGEPAVRALAAHDPAAAGRSRPRHVEPLRPEEAVVLPGLEETLVLLELGRILASGSWDLVVVDGAPTSQALRLLGLPSALRHYLRRLLDDSAPTVPDVPGTLAAVPPAPPVSPGPAGPTGPTGQTGAAAASLSPGAAEASGVEPSAEAYDEKTGSDVGTLVRRLRADLDRVEHLLSSADTSVRLVLTPEAVVVAESRRALTALALFGYHVDGVIANRLFSPYGADPWRRQWAAAQDVALGDVEQSFVSLPIYRSPYRSCEPVGLAELAAFAAEAYGSADPFARQPRSPAIQLGRDGDVAELSVALPNARGAELSLARKENQLVVTVGSYRRVLTLPEELSYAEVVGASLLDGRLVVRFAQTTTTAGRRAVPADRRRGAWQTRA